MDDTDLTAVRGGKLQCPICNEDFNHINKLTSHIFTDHVPADGGKVRLLTFVNPIGVDIYLSLPALDLLLPVQRQDI